LITFKGNDSPQFTREYRMKHFPNPAQAATEIKYSLPSNERVNISIYNVRGQLIKTLINEQSESGLHNVYWDGTDRNCQNVTNGVYMYVLKTDKKILARKMLFMR